MQIISEVDEPTELCAGMIVVAKAHGKLRIRVDLTNKNESILREFHPLPNVDHILAQLAGATVFSKLDANSGFWQIGLSPESAKLTFLSHHLGGSASFSKAASQVVEGIDGALCQMDDILVFGKTTEEHYMHLEATLHKLQEANLTLNEEKCEFPKPSKEYLGSIIDSEGVLVNPKKVEAILKTETPKDQ